jgi:RNA polymerase sigma factor (sigma-70 family)
LYRNYHIYISHSCTLSAAMRDITVDQPQEPSSDLSKLIKLTCSGDEEAFGKIVNIYRNKVIGYCHRMTGSGAEDMAQEIFIKFYLALDRFDASKPVAPFLFRIAHNHCIDILKKKNIHTTPFEKTADDCQEIQIRDESPDAEELLQKAELQKVLDGTATGKERAGLEDHTASCRDCSRELKTLQGSINLLISVPQPDPSPAFTTETVKMAFKAKREQKRRQRVASWYLSGATAILSVFIFAGWNVAIRPAIRIVLLDLLGIILEWRTLFKTLDKILSALFTILRSLGNTTIRVIEEGASPIFSASLIALTLMVLFFIIAVVKSSAFSFKRR